MPAAERGCRKVIEELEALLAGRRFVSFEYGATNCLGLARYMRFDLFLSNRYGLDSEWAVASMGGKLISVERETGVRCRREGGGLEDLLQGHLGPQITAALQESPCRVLTWQSVEPLEALAAASDGHLQILAPAAALKCRLDDKIAFRRALRQLGIEPVPQLICDLDTLDLGQVRRSFGLPCVVQLAISAGGSGTFFISAQEDLCSLQDQHGGKEVIVSKYVSPISPNINAVVCDDLVLVSHPSLQLVGVPECTDKPSAYCGNDFVAAQRLPQAAIQRIYDQTRRIAAWIAGKGFRGLWGIDFVVDGSKVYPLEINPRLQGSTSLLSDLQQMSHQVPLMLAHLAAFMDGGADCLRRSARQWAHPQPQHGAQMVLCSRESDWRVVRGDVQPGVYAWEGSRGVYRRRGLTVADCQGPDEFVVIGNVPVQGTQVEPGVALCKIQTRREVLAGASNKLQPWAAQVCDWVYQAFDLS